MEFLKAKFDETVLIQDYINLMDDGPLFSLILVFSLLSVIFFQ